MSGLFEKARSGRSSAKIAYVLSGGSAKGFCHLGMIESLEKRGIKPDLVIGTSAGSLLGALYCHYGNVGDVIGHVGTFIASDAFKEFEKRYFAERKPAEGVEQSGLRQFFSGLAGTLKNGMRLGKAMVTSAMISERDAVSLYGRIFTGIGFQTLKIPFAAVAVDLVEGRPIIFTAGRESDDGRGVRAIPGPDGLMRAVMASSAIPLIFPAVEIEDHAHTDGYIMSNLPVREARTLLAGQKTFFVGFDVSAPAEQPDADLSVVELVLRLLDLSTRSKQSADRELLDILFQPVEKSYPWSSFAQYKEFIDMGREYMTGERLAAFEKAYLEKCAPDQRRGSFFRRFFSAK